MRILFIWKADYPWDVRVEKVCGSLSAAGHEVHILARNTRGEATEETLAPNLYLHRLRPFSNRRLNRLLTAPLFHNPLWASASAEICRARSIDLIIVRDLPLLLTGLRVGRAFGIPTVYDMAEHYGAMWRDVIREQWYKPHLYLLKNPLWADRIERYCVRRVKHIFVVVEESRQRLISMGVDPHAVSVVSNTPDLQTFAPQTADKRTFGWQQSTVLLYVGHVNRFRGLDLVVRALPRLVGEFPQLRFAVVGSGQHVGTLKALVRRLALGEHVEFPGWIDFRQIPSLIAAADLCLVPHVATDHKNTTIPNKLFDFMACAKPVVVSSAAPLKRIVEKEQCGLVFRSGSVDSLASTLREMLRSPSTWSQMGERGRAAVARQYNWDVDADILARCVESLR